GAVPRQRARRARPDDSSLAEAERRSLERALPRSHARSSARAGPGTGKDRLRSAAGNLVQADAVSGVGLGLRAGTVTRPLQAWFHRAADRRASGRSPRPEAGTLDASLPGVVAS